MIKVAIYTTNTCVYCKATKDFFHVNNISFEEYNVGSDLERRKEMIQKSGQMGVPVITVGDDIVVGFNEPKLRELLGLK